MAVVHQQVGRQRRRREVVHAAGAVGDVAHHDGVLHARMAAQSKEIVTIGLQQSSGIAGIQPGNNGVEIVLWSSMQCIAGLPTFPGCRR